MKNLDLYKYTNIGGFIMQIQTFPTYSVLSKYFYGKSCIEFGSADGGGTKILLKHFDKVVAVDGSLEMIQKLRQNIRSKKLVIKQVFVEDLDESEKFDTIIMCHFLEHVDNPIEILKKAKQLAHKKSRIIINVPNALSLHRQVGVLMGLLSSEYDFNETDRSVGHQRVYDLKKLRKDIEKSHLKVEMMGGFLMKCFSVGQLESFLKTPRQIEAFVKLGERYPELAAEIYAICQI